MNDSLSIPTSNRDAIALSVTRTHVSLVKIESMPLPLDRLMSDSYGNGTAEQERQAKEAALQQAEQERLRAERLAARLRSLSVNPDEV